MLTFYLSISGDDEVDGGDGQSHSHLKYPQKKKAKTERGGKHKYSTICCGRIRETGEKEREN